MRDPCKLINMLGNQGLFTGKVFHELNHEGRVHFSLGGRSDIE